MNKLHITQDDFGYWMLSLEKEGGELSLLAYQFVTPEHLVENAQEMIAEGKVADAQIIVDAPKPPAAAAAVSAETAEEYRRPAPRKAGA
jgi:hypothetical protein